MSEEGNNINQCAKMLYLFYELYENEFILKEEVQMMKSKFYPILISKIVEIPLNSLF